MDHGIQEQEFSEKLSFSVWKRLFSYMIAYKPKLILLIAANIGIAIADVAFPLLIRHAIDTFVQNSTTDGMWLFGLGAAVVIILQVIFIYGFVFLAGQLELYVSRDIRRKAFEHLQELSFSFYDKTPVGYLLARLTSDINRLAETLAWSMVDILWAVAVIFGAAGAMLYLNVTIALYVLSVLPLLFIATQFFQKRIFRQQRVVRRTNSQITSSFNEGIMGAKTTKTLVREDENLNEFSELTDKMRRSSIKAATLNGIYLPCILMISAVGIGFALWQGGVFALQDLLWFGTLNAFINYANQFFQPMQQLARIFSEMQAAQASAERVLDLIDTPMDINDVPSAAEEGTFFSPQPENWPKIRGRVEFRHVDFSYSNGTKVLEDFNLIVEPGQTVALVGETGAGKSTIVNLLCRFYEATGGEILIDGENIVEHSQVWLQSNLGYVLQQPHLFSGTIEDNIRYANRNATREQVVAAAKMVQADVFIDRMKDGYETQVGEGGSRLSTGEKQLISFARALLDNPALFVLDEATSSVDTETEVLVQEAIKTSLENRTSFIIAHRLSTIRHSDIILVVRAGQVVERGTHESLMAEQGYYYRLYTNQFNSELSAQVFEETTIS